MELLRFIFTNFWTFIGTLLLVAVVFEGLAQCISAVKGTYEKRKDH